MIQNYFDFKNLRKKCFMIQDYFDFKNPRQKSLIFQDWVDFTYNVTITRTDLFKYISETIEFWFLYLLMQNLHCSSKQSQNIFHNWRELIIITKAVQFSIPDDFTFHWISIFSPSAPGVTSPALEVAEIESWQKLTSRESRQFQSFDLPNFSLHSLNILRWQQL